MLLTIVATAVVLGVLVFVHELGHFVTAKLADIRVPRFSIGLGPRAWGFTVGETEYVLSWVPLGGYVRMAGMEELESVEGGADADARAPGEEPSPRDFDAKPVGTRAMVISAGVIMNMLFAFFVYAAMAAIWGVGIRADARLGRIDPSALPAGAVALADVPPGSRLLTVGDRDVSRWRDVRDVLALSRPGPVRLRLEGGEAITLELPEDDEERAELIEALPPAVDPVIGQVFSGEPADRAGFEVGDRVVEVEGEQTLFWDDMVAAITGRPGQTIAVVVDRNGERRTLRVTPEPTIRLIDGDSTAVGMIGVSQARERLGPLEALAHGGSETWRWTAFTLEVLRGLVTGRVSARNVGGPILIGQLSGRVARMGVEQLLAFMALLSINLAVFNLLPIPILDGGQLVFLAVEAIRGRALSIEQRIRFSQVGMVVLMALIALVMANDILRLLGI
ncbi:MAG TPA: RIP metalloprotease RseP [Longimicrobiales bacterium]|nr:RIP metalloprotease RseP [Longimicrobiales bacterium]